MSGVGKLQSTIGENVGRAPGGNEEIRSTSDTIDRNRKIERLSERCIASLNSKDFSHAPLVTIKADRFKTNTRFMIGIKANLYIIKGGKLSLTI